MIITTAMAMATTTLPMRIMLVHVIFVISVVLVLNVIFGVPAITVVIAMSVFRVG